MSKLTQSDFGTLLDLASRTDLEQKGDLEKFLGTGPETQNLILKLARKVVVARNVKDGQYLDDKTEKNDAKVEVSITGSAVPRKKRKYTKSGERKPLEIIVPKGCSFNELIPFSIERFDKWLNDKGLKSSKTYSGGMNTLLKNAGFSNMKEITLLALRTVRDSISGPGKSDTNRRLWLKRFNEYVAYEYDKKNGNV